MTLVRTTFNDLSRELENRVIRNDFDLSLYLSDILSNRSKRSPWWSAKLSSYPLLSLDQQLRQLQREILGNNSCLWPLIQNDGEWSAIGSNGLHVLIDVRHFKPSEITVKTTDDYIVVEGDHGERNEGGHRLVQRHFVRKYMLPQGFNATEIVSTLSSDGILSIKAPPPPPIKFLNPSERLVHIQQTGRCNNSLALHWK